MFLLILIMLVNTSFATKINKSKQQNFIYKLLSENNPDEVISPYVLLISKKDSKLYLYLNKAKEKNSILIKTYDIATGKTKGRKQKEGDKKTPEGIYFASQFLDLDYFKRRGQDQVAKYGGFAIALSYPSAVDKLQNRTGNGIWIHGTNDESRISKERDSQGCIVLKNNHLKELAAFVLSKVTPVIIYKESLPNNISFTPDKEIKNFLSTWKNAWETKDIKTFADFYSKDFYNFSSHEDKDKFIKKKTYLAKRYKKITVKVENPSFYYSPHYSIIQFKQIYSSDSYYSEGIKNLFLVKNNQGLYKIVSESFVKESQVKYCSKL